VATSIALFVSFEVVFIDTLRALSFFATAWLWALIALLRIESVVYIAPELGSAMEPRACANENVVSKPFWTVVAGRSTVIRCDVKVPIRTFRGRSDLDHHLSIRLGHGGRKATNRNNSYR
jgi:hypothetical protein